MTTATVTYRRTKNLGNYNAEELVVQDTPAQGETLDQCISRIKTTVLQSLGLEESPAVKEDTVAPAQPSKLAAAKTKPVEAKKEDVAPTVQVAPEVVDTPVLEPAPVVEPTPVVEEAPARPTRTRAAAAPKVKGVPYNRADATHTQKFAVVLTGIDPMWKASAESKAKAKDISTQLEGAMFLDEKKGTVLPEFVEAVKSAWKA